MTLDLRSPSPYPPSAGIRDMCRQHQDLKYHLFIYYFLFFSLFFLICQPTAFRSDVIPGAIPRSPVFKSLTLVQRLCGSVLFSKYWEPLLYIQHLLGARSHWKLVWIIADTSEAQMWHIVSPRTQRSQRNHDLTPHLVPRPCFPHLICHLERVRD